MLTKSDLLESLKLPLGPAVKLYNVIKVLQQKTCIINLVES